MIKNTEIKFRKITSKYPFSYMDKENNCYRVYAKGYYMIPASYRINYTSVEIWDCYVDVNNKKIRYLYKDSISKFWKEFYTIKELINGV